MFHFEPLLFNWNALVTRDNGIQDGKNVRTHPWTNCYLAAGAENWVFMFSFSFLIHLLTFVWFDNIPSYLAVFVKLGNILRNINFVLFFACRITHMFGMLKFRGKQRFEMICSWRIIWILLPFDILVSILPWRSSI